MERQSQIKVTVRRLADELPGGSLSSGNSGQCGGGGPNCGGQCGGGKCGGSMSTPVPRAKRRVSPSR